MSTENLFRSNKKENNRKSGKQAAHQLKKRTEAEARNAAYAKLSTAEKLKTAGAKVRKKLLAKVEKQNGG